MIVDFSNEPHPATGLGPYVNAVWHSAFLALERIRTLLEQHPEIRFDEARQAIMATNIFTTHTPVPAGIDTFSPEMMLAAFRVALDEPARAGEVHRALCGSRRTGACPGVLVVLEHPRR